MPIRKRARVGGPAYQPRPFLDADNRLGASYRPHFIFAYTDLGEKLRGNSPHLAP
jgi:hypothetical protein